MKKAVCLTLITLGCVWVGLGLAEAFDYIPGPEAPFTIWLDATSYDCQDVKVEGKFVTLLGCVGYSEQLESVGGQDWQEISIEVNEQP